MTLKGEINLVGSFTSADLYCRQRWRQVQHLADIFWKRWKKEYLSQLQIRLKWNERKRNVTVGDVVLMQDDSLPRCHWQLGKIISVKPSSDGLVRSVEIKCKSGTFTRPLSKIVMLIENE